jgi:hypothetical protein
VKELINLTNIVTPKSRQPKQGGSLIKFDAPPTSKEEQLVAALREGGADNSTALKLTKKLYGDTSAASKTAFRRLSSRVQDKLLNHLYFLEHSDPRFLVSRRYEVECRDLFMKGMLLISEGEYILSESLLRRAARLAEQGEFTDLLIEALRGLLFIHTFQNDDKKYKQGLEQIEKYQQRAKLEFEAEKLLGELRLSLAKGTQGTVAIAKRLPEMLRTATKLHGQAKSYNTYVVLYRMQLVDAEIDGRYSDLVQLTMMTRQQLRAGKINERRFDQRFNLFMALYAAIRSQQYKKGLELASRYSSDFHPSSNNWVYFYEHYVLLAIHAKEYGLAQQLMTEVKANPTFARQRTTSHERWQIIEAYTGFTQPAETRQRKNMLASYAGLVVSEQRRDKQGHNVAILIFQILYFLRARNEEQVLTRLERLRKYQQRHLRKEETLRSQYFLRLLRLLPEQGFSAAAARKRGAKLLAKLSETPLPPFAELEVIPYEQLWEITLGLLE